MDITAMPRRRGTFAALASNALSAGLACTIEYDPKTIPPDQNDLDVYDDECLAACQAGVFEVPVGCTPVSCGVGVGANVIPDYHVADLLEPGPNGVCQMVIACEEDDCLDEYEDCLDDNHSLHGCEDDYDACVQTNACAEARLECEDGAFEPHCQCLENDCGVTECEPFNTCDGEQTVPPELPATCPESSECGDLYIFECGTCACEEEECLTGNELFCGWGAQFAPTPKKTGPARWKVHHAFIEHAIARLDELRSRTRPRPVRGGSGQWIGASPTLAGPIRSRRSA